ncbi:hypothetical protein HMPREF9440_00765 [Sutterella parvirubra YIT 11816]|uniref:Uncharacterized protein n=1 Tax=Sutterella parvirubra YIT 11816 TaxID=762967 RepID=H3KDF6_9BURK|nr:hypothetical protein HMPREF9440_00765 [Sutterella parvirubra YIT 11816]
MRGGRPVGVRRGRLTAGKMSAHTRIHRADRPRRRIRSSS